MMLFCIQDAIADEFAWSSDSEIKKKVQIARCLQIRLFAEVYAKFINKKHTSITIEITI